MNTNEGAAYGAAIIAGVAVGHWDNLEVACNQLIKTNDTAIEPNEEETQHYQDVYQVWRDVYTRLEGINSRLARLP